MLFDKYIFFKTKIFDETACRFAVSYSKKDPTENV